MTDPKGRQVMTVVTMHSPIPTSHHPRVSYRTRVGPTYMFLHGNDLHTMTKGRITQLDLLYMGW